MNIQIRIVLTVAVASLVALAATYVRFNTIISEEFAGLEIRENRLQARRAAVALEIVQERLVNAVTDWAKWDDTYDYMESRDDAYFESVVTYDYVLSLKAQHILFLDPKGEVVRTFSVNHARKVMEDSKPTLVKYILGIGKLTRPSVERPISGFVRVEGQLFVAASVAIQDSEMRLPSRGAIVFLRALDDSLIAELARQTQLQLVLLAADSGPGAVLSRENDALFASESADGYLRKLDDSEISLYLPRVDLTGQPSFVLQILEKRPTHAQAQHTRNSILWVLCGGTIFTISATILILRVFVVKRIGSLARQALALETNLAQDGKLTCSGRDEVANLAYSFNSLLERLQLTRVDLERACAAAESANSAKSSFLAKVSHELRTPIHGILGMHRMAMRQEKSRAIRELIGVADDCARGLLGTINEILDFSKAESGNLTVEKIPTDVRDVVRAALQIVSGRLDNKPKLSLVCDLDPRVPLQVISDPTRLQQVLVNLLGNAVKFTEQGSVTLRVTYEIDRGKGAEVLFSVIDTGIGIPYAKLNDIFEPFKQADDTVTRKYQGTGLGLSIVKQFCEAVGGFVTVQSTEGHGSTFSVHLPIGDTSSRMVDSLSKVKGWPVPLLVGRRSPTINALLRNFNVLGLPAVLVDPSSAFDLSSFDENLALHNLVVVFDDALQNSEIFKRIIAKAQWGDVARTRCTLAVLAPSSVEVRERLYSAGMATILTAPVMCDDIIDAFFGKIFHREEKEDASSEPLAFHRKLRVLIADDAETNRVILEDMLSSAGHDVVCVHDGREVVEQLTRVARGDEGVQPYDIVLTDIQMPHLDGWNAAKEVRAAEKSAGLGVHTPIIAATAHPIASTDARLKEAGIDGLVTKPIEPRELANQIRLILGGSNQEIVRPNVSETTVAQFEVELDEVVRTLIAEELHARTGEAQSVMHTGDILDIPSLFRRLGRSLPRTLLVLNVSAKSIEERLRKLLLAAENQDTQEVARAAHALKGVLLEVGALSAANLAGSIEAKVMASETVDPESLARFDDQARMVAGLISGVTERFH